MNAQKIACTIGRKKVHVRNLLRRPFPVWSLVLGAFSHFLMVFNSSINILFYCVFNSQFRVEAKKALLDLCDFIHKEKNDGRGSRGGAGVKANRQGKANGGTHVTTNTCTNGSSSNCADNTSKPAKAAPIAPVAVTSSSSRSLLQSDCGGGIVRVTSPTSTCDECLDDNCEVPQTLSCSVAATPISEPDDVEQAATAKSDGDASEERPLLVDLKVREHKTDPLCQLIIRFFLTSPDEAMKINVRPNVLYSTLCSRTSSERTSRCLHYEG